MQGVFADCTVMSVFPSPRARKNNRETLAFVEMQTILVKVFISYNFGFYFNT